MTEPSPSTPPSTSSSRTPLVLVALAVVGLVGALFWANSRSDAVDGSEDTEDTAQEATGDSEDDTADNDAESSVTTSATPAVDLPVDPVDDLSLIHI